MAEDAQQESPTKMLIDLLNEDLRGNLEAIMICLSYSEMVCGNVDPNIAGRLAKQLNQGLQQALSIADEIRSLGGVPEIAPHVVQGSSHAEETLRLKLI